ncbi:mucin-17-like [Maniola jurtina]|uniref:mucin-17-like n=1 Tax=Maniola jurtina TaxID=191418 RepID=UPI001E68C03C|nr:mucin-17-like [Maniola jurtina]
MMWLWLLCVAAAAVFSAEGAGAGAARLVCYVESARASDFTECTHLVYAGDARGEKLDALLKEYRKDNPRVKIVLRVSEVDKNLPDLLKSKHVQGLEIHDAHKTLNKTKVLEKVEAAREAISSSGGGPLFLALPAHPELLAKYYDLRALMKKVDLMMVQTHALGLVKKMTYHPSRLSGLWDMMNTDSVVDLVVGLGVPASKIVISLPATARQFKLQNETLSTPGSPTENDEPKEIDQAELCRQLRKGRWTLERDQDLSAPYAFKDKTWISFEDASSVDVKGKYARVRGLAGLALYKADRDTDTPCAPTLRTALTKVLNQQSRAPRAAVLRSLENEILSAPSVAGRALDALQVSPYRITQVVDSDGVIHSIREDTRTEFSCSRQGYYVHPRSCARFYRCVKFDQLSPEYTVFEFDCPAGLAFDSRYEVCGWPGSLPYSQACPGSSEIAPVPRTRFVCPDKEGYFADPENCRWFFACLDHGKAPLTAYEFRCPFGLGFDAARLKCDWPWLVPACGNIARYEAEAFGFSGAALTGATGFQGKTADSVNIAAHQSLVSGASLDNLVGIQGGLLSKDDILDSNYIASQEAANLGFAGPGTYQINDDYAIGSQGESSGHSYNIVAADDINRGLGLVQTTNYNGGERYTSGSLILDDYRLPAASSINSQRLRAKVGGDSGKYKGNDAYVGVSPKYDSSRYNAGAYYRKDNSGKYVHNPAGDRAKPYEHLDIPPVPYTQTDIKYTQSSSSDSGSYSQSSGGYVYPKPAIAFNEEPGTYQSLYKIDGQLDAYTSGASGTTSGATSTYYGSDSNGNVGEYVTDENVYTGAPHVLTAGAVRVGLVGKTSLIDANYSDQGNYQTQSYSQDVVHQTNEAGSGVSITQFGTTQNDGYSYVTNPTSSGVPTTATPLPVTYKTTYVPLVPKTSIKQVFGYTQPAVTYVQPTVVPVKQVAPQIQLTNNYNQGLNYEYESKDYSSTYNTGSTGYDYSKPAVKFEDSVSYTTAAPSATVISYKPQGFGHQQQTIHKVESVGFEYSTPRPVSEPPFRKLVAYTTGTPETYVQPTAQSYSQQTLHKVESSNVYTPSVDVSSQVSNTYEVPQTVVQYSAPQPAISVQPTISTYQPQSYSQQTLHTVDTGKVNSYSQNQQEQGYEYQQPTVYVQSTGAQYSTAGPTVSYQPQSYSSQTIQRYNTQQYVPVSSTARPVTSTPVTVYENPLLKYTVKATPATYVSPYVPSRQAFSQQTVHREDTKTTAAGSSGYEYVSGARYEQPQTTVYTTAQPQVYSQQTLHQVDAGQVNNYQGSSVSGYEYSQPAVTFEQKFVSSTPAPIVTSTYRPQTFRQKVVSTTSQPNLLYRLTDVSLNENPLLKYTETVEPVTYVKPTSSVFTQSYQPTQQTRTSYVSKPAEYESTAQQTYVSQEGYSYNQPETVSQIATSNRASYSDASAVSHQFFHQGSGNTQYENGKGVFVSTTPATLVYEDHYAEYESPRKVKTYKAPDYIPPKQQYQQEVTYSTASTPIFDQRNSFVRTQDQYDYRPADYSQQYESSVQYTDSKSSSGSSQTVESVHFTTVPDTRTTYQYNQGYQSPEIQVGYKAEEYLPPVVSTETPVVTSTYRPRTYSTTREYLPPTTKPNYTAPEYLPPVDTYITQSTAKPEIKSLEYLPPSSETVSRVVNYESFGYNNDESRGSSRFGTYQDYSVPTEGAIVVSSTAAPIVRQQNIVVQNAKANLLGFGTVGPDAGLVSTTYTTAQPIASGSNSYYLSPKTVTSTYAPELVEVTSAPRRTKTKYIRPAVKSTTESNYYVESTRAYQAPEYLPPSEDTLQENIGLYGYKSTTGPEVRYNPYQGQEQVVVSTTSAPKRKQNIVVETAKSQLLGFGTIGNDAGLVASGSYSTPESVAVSYSTVPIRQEIVEVTSARAPIRRTKPKVAVVTKINDFNPLLVRKLGAVCSCQSPVLVLKGRRPSVQEQGNDEYTNGYDDAGRGDIGESTWAQKSTRISTVPAVNTVTVAPVSSTFNPIIVPDDSFYQDYQDNSYNIPAASARKDYSESYVSSTPAISTTERIVRIKPRVKAVTVAPTYRTVLLSEGVTPTAAIQESGDTVSVDSQTFDRYGPGGWRSRDETLQGSIDCQRAGLFRHPKQCNKFYACRWDCTKQRFTLHIFNCPVQLSFDPNLGACNWPSQGPACQGDTLLTNSL